MFWNIFFFYGKKTGKREQPLRRRPKKIVDKDTLQTEGFRKQLRKARLKFQGDYDSFLVYLNAIATNAALEKIGISRTKQNRRIFQMANSFSKADFQNLITTSEKVSPDYRVRLLKLLGTQKLREFLDMREKYRTLLFRIEDSIAEGQ